MKRIVILVVDEMLLDPSQGPGEIIDAVDTLEAAEKMIIGQEDFFNLLPNQAFRVIDREANPQKVYRLKTVRRLVAMN